MKDLAALQAEIGRVLKPDGIAVHVLPTGVWRLWSLVSGYIEGAAETIRLVKELLCGFGSSEGFYKDSLRARWQWIVKDYWLPRRHGEVGNAYSEIWTFSRFYWIPRFRRDGFLVKQAVPTGLFYTGNMFLGKRLGLSVRTKIACILGSACYIYVLSPS